MKFSKDVIKQKDDDLQEGHSVEIWEFFPLLDFGEIWISQSPI